MLLFVSSEGVVVVDEDGTSVNFELELVIIDNSSVSVVKGGKVGRLKTVSLRPEL